MVLVQLSVLPVELSVVPGQLPATATRLGYQYLLPVGPTWYRYHYTDRALLVGPTVTCRSYFLFIPTGNL